MLNKIEDALKRFSKGEIIIVVDDENRENEGDFVASGELINAKKINFMAKEGRGLICAAIDAKTAKRLELPAMVKDAKEVEGADFRVSVDASEGITTGISAYDRAKTIKILASKSSSPDDLVRPGHIFPLLAKGMGVLQRAGHTEASVDLCTLSGLSPCGIICEIMLDNGKMARMKDLIKIAEKYSLKIISIEDLIKYRMRKENLVKKITEFDFPTKYGYFKGYLYKTTNEKEEHIALVKGDIAGKKNILVRVHSECLTGDALHSLRCDCGDQLDRSMEIIENEGKGVVLYMRQEGRGIGLHNKLKAYNLQDAGLDTVEANKALGFKDDLRDYGVGAQILKDLGLSTIKLLTNNPKKIVGLKGYGLEVVETIPMLIKPNKYNLKYLRTKKEKLKHRLNEEYLKE